MRLRRLLVAALAAGVLMVPTASEALSLPIEMPSGRTTQNYFVASNFINGEYDLNFNANEYKEYSMKCGNQVVNFVAFENIVYVKTPKDASHQTLSIYVPKAYLDGRTVNGYSAKQAPIFMPNGVGGYMPGEILKPEEKDKMTGGPNASLVALTRGYVVVAPAIRGRTTKSSDGTFVGKAPSFIVDYKAAVRYIRANRENLPAGDPEKIISNGTSAGGALSALLGTTGNSPDYEPYLQEIGALSEADDIFATSAYCPITNLDHADAAYEWIFNGTNNYYDTRSPILGQENRTDAESIETKVSNKVKNTLGGLLGNNQSVADAPTSKKMTQTEIDISDILKGEFSSYVNSLNLHDETGLLLNLDDRGNGPFRNYIKRKYMESAQAALDAGKDLSAASAWLTIKDGKVTDADLSKYPEYVTRMKAAPAFDKLDLSSPSPENDEFGTERNEPQHFTSTSSRYQTRLGAMADSNVIKMMNPMNYINSNATVAEHFRIRHGAADRDTSLAIPAILALSLQQRGADVDFDSPWDVGHSGDYDLEELFNWIDFICKKDPTVPITRN